MAALSPGASPPAVMMPMRLIFFISQSSKPAMPAMIFFQRGEKLLLAKIRPERGGNDHFSVGNLPQKKIAHAHFAAGADEQIRIGHVARVKVLRENFFGDVLRVQFARLR